MEPQEKPIETVKESPQNAPVSAQVNPLTSIPAAILTGAAMIAFVLILLLHPGSTPTTGTAATAQPTTTASPDSTKVSTANEPFIGNANAPLTMDYWFDYQCPFCQQDEESVLPQIIANYVNTGKLKIVFKDYAFLGPDSQTLGTYARAVWEAAPTQFYAWHKAIFDNQGKENSGWATQAKITAITSKVLGATLSAQVTQLVASKGNQYQQSIDADKAEATKFGVQGTPAAIIGTQLVTGAEPYAQFQTVIDSELKK